MKTFKDLIKGDKIYHIRNNKIEVLIFEKFDKFNSFWGKGYDLIVCDRFRMGIPFNDDTLNSVAFLNYYTCLEALIFSINHEDI